MAEPIAVINYSRTDAIIFEGLSHILRSQFKLSITACAEWTLKLMNKWEACGRRGICSLHPSLGYQARVRRTWAAGRTDDAIFLERSMCTPVHRSVYTGTGNVGVFGQRANLRTRIQRQHVMPWGSNFTADVWVRLPDGTIKCGRFELLQRGGSYVSENATCPDTPPSSLAFTQKSELAVGTPLPAAVRQAPTRPFGVNPGHGFIEAG